MGRPWGCPNRKVTAPPIRGRALKKLDRAQKLLWKRLRIRPSQSETVEHALVALIEKLQEEEKRGR